MRDVDRTADALAMKFGIDKTAMIRARAGISFALTEALDEGMRVPAGDIEALVLDRLRAFFSSFPMSLGRPVRALLVGSQSNALTPSRLLRLSKDLPHDWKEQRRFLGFAA